MIEKENKEYSTVIINNPKNEKLEKNEKMQYLLLLLLWKKIILLLIKRHCLKPFKK